MNTFFSPDELREITNRIIASTKKELTEQEAKAEAKRQAEKVKQVARAEAIMATFAEKTFEAASRGKGKCVLFKLAFDDYRDRYNSNQDLKVSSDLSETGAAFLVADICTKMGYEVSISYEWDGGGMSSWHNFMVSW